MDLKASLLRNKSQNFAVNIFEVTTFSTKQIFYEMSCITGHYAVLVQGECATFEIWSIL